MPTKKRTKHKNTSARLSGNKNPVVVVAVSGGFDPIHIGHVRMFNEAKALGDKLVVILNNDHWLRKKKGGAFMPEHERREVLEALGAVDEVMLTAHPENPDDMSICGELLKLRPHIFANGGDRNAADSKKKTSSLSPEADLCERLGIRMAFNVGKGGKVQSSSWLLKRYNEYKK